MDTVSAPTNPTPPQVSSPRWEPVDYHNIPVSRVIAAAVFVILVSLVGVSAYYLGSQDRGLSQSLRPSDSKFLLSLSPIPTFIKQPVTKDSNVSITDEWTVGKSENCGVDMPVPPQKDPYVVPDDPATPDQSRDEGGYWQFEDYEANMFFFPSAARTIFRNETSGGDYVSGDVEVHCASNDARYTTESLMARLESELPDGITIAGKRQSSKWNENTYIVQFKGGLFNDNEHYVFATPKYIYLVRLIGMSSNPDIVAATGLIFDNLLFSR